MKVLFDAQWWEGGPPSGSRVVRSIVSSWHLAFPDDLLGVYGRASDFPAYAAVHQPMLRQHGLANIFGLGQAARGYDAVISQNFTPLRRAKRTGTLVHDTIYVRHPEWFTIQERAYLASISLLAKRAGAVFSTSRTESEHVSRVIGRPVVPIGLSVGAEHLRPVAERSALVDVPERFLLAVGRLNIRKNLFSVIEPLRRAGVLSPARPLVVVGQPDGRLDPRLDDVADREVLFLSDVNDDELAWLYGRTDLFVFPSLDEGFGIPLLEAAAAGANIAASDIPVFREVLRGYANVKFFNPEDAASIRESCVQALDKKGQFAPLEVPDWLDVVSAMREALLGGSL